MQKLSPLRLPRVVGFTLVELIVVMILLGILSAMVLPRFMNLHEPAHEASVKTVGGAFAGAIQMVNALWRMAGSIENAQNIAGFGQGDIDVNVNGWPTDTLGVSTIPVGLAGRLQCSRLLQSLLLNGPSVSTREFEFNWFTKAYAGGGAPPDPSADYWATASAANQCTFTYQPHPNLSIVYNCLTGEVLVDSDASS